MNATPRVTVLMPVRNGGPYLRDAIGSVLAQTFVDFELLIVHDASENIVLDIATTFHDPRIRFLPIPGQQGLADKLNHGLAASQGEYVARMDADDVCYPDRLREQVAFLDGHPDSGMCGTWARTIGPGASSEYRHPVDPDTIRAAALFESPFVHPTVMLRRFLFERFHLQYDASYDFAEDFDLWTRAVECFPCWNLPQVLLSYRLHTASMTAADWARMNTQAERVALRPLRTLGLEPGPDDLRLHRRLARGCSYRCPTLKDLQEAEAWLLALRSANARSQRYEEKAFRATTSAVWFRVCVTSAHVGWSVLRQYLRSPLCPTPWPDKRLAELVWRTLSGPRADERLDPRCRT